MIDYSTWTDEQINVEIGKRLGWIIVNEKLLIGIPDASGLAAYQKIPDWTGWVPTAWQLVEERHAKHDCLTLAYGWHRPGQVFEWLAHFRHAGGIGLHVNLARAICEAWLKAKKGEG